MLSVLPDIVEIASQNQKIESERQAKDREKVGVVMVQTQLYFIRFEREPRATPTLVPLDYLTSDDASVTVT